MKLSASIFPLPSRDGQLLIGGILPLFQEAGFEAKIHSEASQSDFIKACAWDDAVFADATIEPDGAHQYAIFSAQPMGMDHVLIGSRTYLPLNFYGLREGGAPHYPSVYLNFEIVRWLRTEL